MSEPNDTASHVTALAERVEQLQREVQIQSEQLTRAALASAIDTDDLDRLRTVADVCDAAHALKLQASGAFSTGFGPGSNARPPKAFWSAAW